MPSYTVNTTTEQDEVGQWEAGNNGVTLGELIQGVVDRYLSERKGHFDQPKERLARLTTAERAQIPAPIRTKLGI